MSAASESPPGRQVGGDGGGAAGDAERSASQVFISYAREDSAFVDRVAKALNARGFDTWIDLESIPASAEWWERIAQAIAASTAVVFVISEDSVGSEVCRRELDEAATMGTRLIPVLYRATRAEVPEVVSKLHWLAMTAEDAFDEAAEQLERTLRTDLAWEETLARLTLRARSWQPEGGDDGPLLRGEDLDGAVRWLADRPSDRPVPSQLAAFIEASGRHQTAEEERYRRLYGTALTRQVAAQARVLREESPDNLPTSVALAAESLRRCVELGIPRLEAEQSLRAGLALLAMPVRELSRDSQARVGSFSPDGALLLTTGPATTLIASRVNDSEEVARFELEDPIEAATFDPGGGHVVAAAGGRVHAFDLDGHPLFEAESGPVHGLSFSAEGDLLAAAAEDAARVWSFPSGEPRGVFEARPPVLAVALCAGGRRLAAAPINDKPRLWDLETGQQLLDDEVMFMPHEVLVRSDDRLVVFGDQLMHQVAVFDAESGELAFHRLGPHTSAFARSSPLLAVGTDDKNVQLWDLRGPLKLRHIMQTSGVTSLAFSPDDALLAAGLQDGLLRVWETTGYTEVARYVLPTAPRSVAFHPSGRHVLAECEEERVATLQVAPLGEYARFDTEVAGLRVAFAPDHPLLALRARLGPGQGENRVYDPFTGTRVKTVDPNSDADLTAETAARWLGDKHALAEGVPSPDGSRTARADGHEVVIEHPEDGAGKTRTTLLHPSRVTALAFSPDGTHLAAGCEQHAARIWSLDRFEEVSRLTHENPSVNDVAFSPDGRLLAVVGWEPVARLWVWQPDDLIAFAGQRLSHNLSHEQWQRYFGDLPYRATFEGLPAGG